MIMSMRCSKSLGELAEETPENLRKIGMTVLANHKENQWKIDRSICDYNDVFEGRTEDDGIPF